MKALLATAVALTLVLFGFAKTPTAAATGASQQAVNTLRLINTAEVHAYRAQARYVSFPELVSSGALKKAADMSPAFISVLADLDLKNGAPVRGFDMAVVISSDGGAYKLSLTAKDDCGSAFFTDQRGIIYIGQAIGCPVS